MITYRIQKTSKGDFIVRNMGDREMARFDTESEAQDWIDQKNATETQEENERETSRTRQNAWDKTTPHLYDAQLVWQQFMHEFYNELHSESNRVRLQSRMADGLNSSSVSAEHHRQSATEDAVKLRDAQLVYHGEATDLDTRIKEARRSQDAEQLTQALAEAETLMPRMAGMLPNIVPPKKSPRAGTKPNTSIVLTQEELGFIERKLGGSKSAAIHEALRRLMDNGTDSN